MTEQEPRMASTGDVVCRTYSRASLEQRRTLRPGSRIEIPMPFPQAADAGGCPPAILDADPTGTGVGIWVLVATHPDEEFQCEYEYAVGIYP